MQRHRVEIPHVKHCTGVSRRGGTNVSAFAVADQQGIWGDILDVRNCLLKCQESVHAERFVERQLRLVGAHKVFGGIDYGTIELSNVVDGHSTWIGVKADANQRPA